MNGMCLGGPTLSIESNSMNLTNLMCFGRPAGGLSGPGPGLGPSRATSEDSLETPVGQPWSSTGNHLRTSWSPPEAQPFLAAGWLPFWTICCQFVMMFYIKLIPQHFVMNLLWIYYGFVNNFLSASFSTLKDHSSWGRPWDYPNTWSSSEFNINLHCCVLQTKWNHPTT